MMPKFFYFNADSRKGESMNLNRRSFFGMLAVLCGCKTAPKNPKRDAGFSDYEAAMIAFRNTKPVKVMICERVPHGEYQLNGELWIPVYVQRHRDQSTTFQNRPVFYDAKSKGWYFV